MKLTGGAKEQFEKWFNTHHVYEHLCLATFQELHESMQWGVIQDFADSLHIELSVTVFHSTGQFAFRNRLFKTRQEARNAAIEKLNEIINQNK